MDLPGSSLVAFLPNPSRRGRHKKRTGGRRIWFRFIRTLFISITTVARDDESLLRSPFVAPSSRPRSNSTHIYFLPCSTQWRVHLAVRAAIGWKYYRAARISRILRKYKRWKFAGITKLNGKSPPGSGTPTIPLVDFCKTGVEFADRNRLDTTRVDKTTI